MSRARRRLGGGLGVATGASPNVFDFIAGPALTDLSLANALIAAGEKNASTGNPVLIGLKPGNRSGSYLFDELSVPGDVHLVGVSQETTRIDGQLNFLTGGRRVLRNIYMENSNNKNCIRVDPSAFAVVLLREGQYVGGSGVAADSAVEVLSANGVLLCADVQIETGADNVEPAAKITAGGLSIQNNSLLTTFDYDTPVLLVSGGFCTLRRMDIQNPISISGGGLLAEYVSQDAFQLFPQLGSAVNISNGAAVTLRGVKISNADGRNNAVFRNLGGGGFLAHDMLNVEQLGLGGAGTLIGGGITETRLKERSGTAI